MKYACMSANINPRLNGYFHSTTDGEGLFLYPIPHNSGSTMPIYKIQKAFNRPWKVIKGNLIFVYLMVTDDVTGQVKIKMFEDLSFLVLSRTIIVSTVSKQLIKLGSCLGQF